MFDGNAKTLVKNTITFIRIETKRKSWDRRRHRKLYITKCNVAHYWNVVCVTSYVRFDNCCWWNGNIWKTKTLTCVYGDFMSISCWFYRLRFHNFRVLIEMIIRLFIKISWIFAYFVLFFSLFLQDLLIATITRLTNMYTTNLLIWAMLKMLSQPAIMLAFQFT